MNRREFLVVGPAAVLNPVLAAGQGKPARAPKSFFGLHPVIEKNPKAVFIRRTNVPHKMDAAAKLREGLALAREIFVPLDKPGIPVTHRIVLKPNATGVRSRRPPEENWGTGTDPQFYEGMVLGLKELGLRKFHFIESTGYETWDVRGFNDINDRLGVEINEPGRRPRHLLEGYETNWHTVPDGVVFKRIPHYAPVGEPDTWLFNIAKWKAHSMCLTLSVKNLQGLVAHPFTSFCSGWDTVLKVPDYVKPDINPRVEEIVNAFFERHRKMGYARYDASGNRRFREAITPIRQEIWAHKTCDNLSTLNAGLSMIEGIYGRDGDGFDIGNDYLTNLVMFGKDKFRLDTIGHYLGGHEPGNVHFLRIGKERGLSDTFNPWEIPLYEWVDGKAVPRKLTDFPRTPLKTPYLQRDGEPALHLVDEPFDYERNKV
ncbi:MAG: DUF362 domain-containing protein [Bryobacterales bacterium]|nr:DUF362 domain-containing protein [Bryobacterales bacterium]